MTKLSLFGVLQEQTTRKLKQETFAQLNAKQQKLDLLRNIINQDSEAGNSASRQRTGKYTKFRLSVSLILGSLCDHSLVVIKMNGTEWGVVYS